MRAGFLCVRPSEPQTIWFHSLAACRTRDNAYLKPPAPCAAPHKHGLRRPLLRLGPTPPAESVTSRDSEWHRNLIEKPVAFMTLKDQFPPSSSGARGDTSVCPF